MGRSTLGALRWNAASLVGKQLVQIFVALVLARLLGPEAYGITSIAVIFITISSLIMDQGLSAALIQTKVLVPKEPGAVVTANIAVAVVLGLILAVFSSPIAEFFSVPQLSSVLVVVGAGLLLKAMSIVPRALLSRELRFAPIASADVGSAIVAGAAGVIAALNGAGYWSVVVQILVSDAVTAIYLLSVCRGPLPNRHLRTLLPLLGFSTRIFASSILSSVSRNSDNFLVGRFLGASALGYYSIAYKVLLVPVQMLGFVTTRVLFPSFARGSEDTISTRANVDRVTRMLAVLAIPLMGFVAVASPDGVTVILGEDWLPVVPVLQVLAITGARQAVYSITAPLMTGFGKADWHLRFSIVATAVQLAGIVAGLQFGIIGVAIGYTAAGFVMTPAMYWIQHRIIGGSLRRHLAMILPAVHATFWAYLVYLPLSELDVLPLVRLVLGLVLFVIVFVSVLALAHRQFARAIKRDILDVLGRKPR